MHLRKYQYATYYDACEELFYYVLIFNTMLSENKL